MEYTIFEQLVHSDWRRRHRQTTTGKSSPTKAPAPKASVGAAQCLSTASSRTHGGFTTCKVTPGNGSRIAGTTATLATPVMAAREQAIAPEFQRGLSLERRELVISEPACVPTFATVECVQQRHRCQVCVESHSPPIFSHRTRRPFPIAPILDEAAFHDFSSRPMTSTCRDLVGLVCVGFRPHSSGDPARGWTGCGRPRGSRSGIFCFAREVPVPSTAIRQPGSPATDPAALGGRPTRDNCAGIRGVARE